MAYSYLAPLIFPILPRRSGTTHIDLPIGPLIDDAGIGATSGDLTATLTRYEGGAQAGAPEIVAIKVRDGAPDLATLSRSFAPEDWGFLALALDAAQPFFRKITTEIVTSIVERPNGSVFNISANSKFAEPPVVKQIQATRKFCVVHTGNYVSRAENAGNSTLIVNPFDGPLVAKLTSETGVELKRRIAPGESALISLENLLVDGVWGGVMYTGSNRFPAWDVRHDFDDAGVVHHVDHLEYYRGEDTRPALSAPELAKAVGRDILRDIGLRVG